MKNRFIVTIINSENLPEAHYASTITFLFNIDSKSFMISNEFEQPLIFPLEQFVSMVKM